MSKVSQATVADQEASAQRHAEVLAQRDELAAALRNLLADAERCNEWERPSLHLLDAARAALAKARP